MLSRARSSSLPLEYKRQMKKLQLFILISSVLLASYAYPADFLITDDVNTFCVESDYNGRSELRAIEHASLDKPFLILELFSYPYISSDVGIVDSQPDTTDIDMDISEESKINVPVVTMMLSDFEGTPVLTVRCPAAGLFRFPLDAYRLRI